MKKKGTKAERREEKTRRKMSVHGRGMRDLAARLSPPLRNREVVPKE